MQKNIKVFQNAEFGSVRTWSDERGEAWFVGKDVAMALGYAKPENAVAAHVCQEDKTSTLIQGSGSNYKSQAVIINESGLYSLILSSKLPGAKRFKHWVTAEVLPQIRRTGGYIPTRGRGGRTMSDEEIMAQALQISQRTVGEQRSVIESQQRTIEEQRPKALFHDCVAESEETCSVAEMAKMIEANGYPMGQKRLFEWLRNNGYLCTRGGQFYNTPYQRWVEQGLFRIETHVGHGPDGEEYVSHTTRVTGKGQAHLIAVFFSSVG